VTGRREKRRKHLLNDLKNREGLEIERGNTVSQSVVNSLWRRIWTCCKADYRMNISAIVHPISFYKEDKCIVRTNF
jgi:hypothetical protein